MDQHSAFLLTRQRVWTLTGISVVVFILLSWIFADGLLTPPLWSSADWSSSPIITYVMIAAILLIGWRQASRVPPEGIALPVGAASITPGQVEDPLGWRLLMGNIFLSVFWLPFRFFVGREWFTAGLHKVEDPGWTGGGAALQGYWERAVAIPEGGRPAITYDWFRQFLQFMLDNGWYGWFAPLVAWGETLVGLGLIVGAFVGLAAFFGTLMNFNFMLAGAASTNPVLFGLGVFLVLAWKVAGFWGLDRWLLPALGTPWDRGIQPVAATRVAPAGGQLYPERR